MLRERALEQWRYFKKHSRRVLVIGKDYWPYAFLGEVRKLDSTGDLCQSHRVHNWSCCQEPKGGLKLVFAALDYKTKKYNKRSYTVVL